MTKNFYTILLVLYTISVIAQTNSSDQVNQVKPTTDSFRFVAFGDMPYFLPKDDLRFENLIEQLNQGDQVFNVFVGDFKSSKTKCNDSIYYKMFHYFEKFKAPLFYTPGDNEWTDCRFTNNVRNTPEERLFFLRKLFFTNSSSLGLHKMKTISESSLPKFKKFVENQQWNYGGVSFATIHIVGSNNNLKKVTLEENTEFQEREEASLFWLKNIFQTALSNNSLGIVIMIHADIINPEGDGSGFKKFITELKKNVEEYKKPILLIHGDSHKFIIDKPFTHQNIADKTIMNFTRLQVFGETDMHAVEITVEPSTPNLFHFREVWINKNNP
ncbi:hypothetical protein [Flavobacterium sp. 7A]|uniref:hypothetical protein n=1 Tax=Flavobacterium sp. 7A TaxID=2940571 RepID=UPI002227947B|nr:hypothetical protein [Flavobacterium sp. 7A]MCW2119250.1 hypothetical protein [Flavobacterium sp. 7A]